MARTEDFEELAQLVAWGNVASSYAIVLGRLAAGQKISPPVMKERTENAVDLVQTLTDALQRRQSRAFTRTAVHAAVALNQLRSDDINTMPTAQKYLALMSSETKLDETTDIEQQLDVVRKFFSDVGTAMTRAAEELMGRETTIAV